MHCPETEGARHCAHDRIADPLLSDIASEAEGDWVQWNRQVTWKIPMLMIKTDHPPQDRDPPKPTGGTCGIPCNASGLCVLDTGDDPN
eukprot:2225321-Rhodomonas_salina.2